MQEGVSRRTPRERALFREVNERIRELNAAFATLTATFTVVCECADPACIERLDLPAEDYDSIRRHGDRFVVRPDHVRADVDRVVAAHDAYAVIEVDAGNA